MFRALFIITFMLSAIPAWGWRNAYVKFTLPPEWNCKLEGAEWVCENIHKDKGQPSEAIIILTAKEVGPADTFQNYMDYLRTERIRPSENGNPVKSTVHHVERRSISDQPWV